MSHAAVDYASNYIGRPIPWKDGEGNDVAVPASLVAALLLIVSDLYANREGSIEGSSFDDNPAVERFLHFYRIGLGA